MNKSPLIVSGIGRSGTSAVISSMSKHRLVVRPERIGEAPFIGHFMKFLLEYENNSQNRDYHLKNYQLDEPERNKVFYKLITQLQYGFDVDTTSEDKKFWIAKVSFDKTTFDKFLSIFPNLRLIYVMRNGIEVVNSAMAFEGFKDLSFKQLCLRWRNNLQDCKYAHSNSHCAVIRHDRLVDDPRSVFTEVFNKLDIEYDDSPAKFIASTLFNSSFDKSMKIGSTNNIFRNRSKCWEDWSDQQKETFIDICGPCMTEYGFPAPYNSCNVDASLPTTSRRNVKHDKEISDTTEIKTVNVLIRGSMNLAQFNYHANPSIKNGYFFMENPKVASTSILKVLQKLEDADKARLMSNPHNRNESPFCRFTNLKSTVQHEILESDSIFRFAFVRDPYSRLLSAYLSKIVKSLRPKADILAIKQGKKKELITDLSTHISFREFVQIICDQETMDMNVHWKPQVDQILYSKIDYSFIGKFESLEEDFSFVIQRLFATSDDALQHSSNITNSSLKLRDYYTPDIEEMVYKRFANDFSTFKYKRYLPEELAA